VNLDEVETLIPADGVYAVLATIDDQPLTIPSACNIGPNPTFGEQIRKVEAHLIDFSGDLYGRSVELLFLQRLRPTRKFAGLDDLLQQIRQDIEQARQIGLAAANARGRSISD
jgi:riboflavin kinase/FMN adenylyltransferase